MTWSKQFYYQDDWSQYYDQYQTQTTAFPAQQQFHHFPQYHPDVVQQPIYSEQPAFDTVNHDDLKYDMYSVPVSGGVPVDYRRSSIVSVESDLSIPPNLVQFEPPQQTLEPTVQEEWGEADADGEEDWDPQQQQHHAPPAAPQFTDHDNDVQLQNLNLCSPYLQPKAEQDDGGESEATRDALESEFESESPSEDDDDEYRPNGRPRRRSSYYPSSVHSDMGVYVGSSEMFYGSQGRTLRPRSQSARYVPYPGYCSPSSTDAQPLPYDDYALGSPTPSASRRRNRPTPSMPIPVPVPNLTKKSRGRRVPTVSSLDDLRTPASGASRKRQGSKNMRMYLCVVEGCGKCFARGEHLKRHIRSIHTHEKRESLF